MRSLLLLHHVFLNKETDETKRKKMKRERERVTITRASCYLFATARFFRPPISSLSLSLSLSLVVILPIVVCQVFSRQNLSLSLRFRILRFLSTPCLLPSRLLRKVMFTYDGGCGGDGGGGDQFLRRTPHAVAIGLRCSYSCSSPSLSPFPVLVIPISFSPTLITTASCSSLLRALSSCLSLHCVGGILGSSWCYRRKKVTHTLLN